MSTTSLRRRGFGGTSATKDYIKDGLVFHLDGSDLNTVTHKWMDRIGDMVFDMSNGVTRNDAGNGAVFSDLAEGHYNGGFPYSDWGYSVTVEVVYDTDKSDYGIISDSSGSNDRLIQTICVIRKIRCKRKGTTWPVTNNNKHTISISESLCYDNSKKAEPSGTFAGTPATTNRIWLGRQDISPATGNPRYSFIGTIYQIRIYNRVLTEDEVLYNQSIDAEKYGITLN